MWMIFQKFSKRQILTLTWWNRPQFKNRDGIICDGSIRSGKTLSMTISFVIWAMSRYNGQTFALCGKTIEALRRNVVSHMPVWLGGVVNIVERRSENKLIITYKGRTNYFYLFGGKDESSAALIQGMTLAGVLFDEVALMPRSFVEQALARCSVSGSKYWFNCNPEGPLHWFYLEWIQKTAARNMLYLHFTMTDNLSLAPEIRRRYEGMYTGVFYSRYILGLWVKAEGLVYSMFDDSKHVVDYVERYSPRHRYYVSIDYGTVNPFAAGLYDYNPREQCATKFRELYYKGGSANRVDNEAYYKMLKELIGDYPITAIIIDPSAAAMIETIQKYGEYTVRGGDNDVLNGIQDVTKFLNAGCLKIDRNCIHTREEFKMYCWDDKKTEDAVIKENDHAMDELRYFCRTILREELFFIV